MRFNPDMFNAPATSIFDNEVEIDAGIKEKNMVKKTRDEERAARRKRLDRILNEIAAYDETIDQLQRELDYFEASKRQNGFVRARRRILLHTLNTVKMHRSDFMLESSMTEEELHRLRASLYAVKMSGRNV